jgi:hypothetical protein
LSTPTRTLEAVHILQDSGISSQGAEALIKAVDLLQGARDYATKADVEAVRSDLRIAGATSSSGFCSGTSARRR